MFFKICGHLPQEVFHWEQLVVLADFCERDCSSSFCFANRMSEEISAPHDTLNANMSCFRVFQNLAPNPADHVPCPVRKIFLFRLSSLHAFSKTLKASYGMFVLHVGTSTAPASVSRNNLLVSLQCPELLLRPPRLLPFSSSHPSILWWPRFSFGESVVRST